VDGSDEMSPRSIVGHPSRVHEGGGISPIEYAVLFLVIVAAVLTITL